MILFLAVLFDIILNIPFGYWRANTKRFSIRWFLSIHLPIPFIILIRIYSGIGFEIITYPIMISAFLLGQQIGYKHYIWRKENGYSPLSSCLFTDIAKFSSKTESNDS